jgi:hypothetical protein
MLSGAIHGIPLFLAVILGIPLAGFVLEQFVRGLRRDKRRRG